MVSAILAERDSRLLNALAGACRTQNTCLMTVKGPQLTVSY